MKHIKPFKLFESGTRKMLETDHEWDFNDAILLLTYYRIKKSLTSVERTLGGSKRYIDSEDVDNELKKKLGLDKSYLAEDIIGCSLAALDLNADNIRFLMEGEGKEHYSKVQSDVVDKYGSAPIDELINMSEKIISEIESDKARMEENQEKKQKRYEEAEERKIKKMQRDEEREKERQEKEQLQKQLSKQGIKRGISLKELGEMSASLKPGDDVSNLAFGDGVVMSVDGNIVTVDFNGTIKKMVANRLEKK